METEELKALAMDLSRRVSALDWLTDALLIAGMYPSTNPLHGPGARTVTEHVILIGPSTDRPPPIEPLTTSRRSDTDWIRVSPHWSGVMDQEMFDEALATQPLPVDGKAFNFMAVHYQRRHGNGGSVRYLFAHHEEMDEPGAEQKLSDDEWVHSTMSAWLDPRPTTE